MNFTLTEDQLLLKANVERFFSKEYDFRKRAAILQTGGYSPDMWEALADLGLIAAGLPEEVGGLGGGGVETMIIMEACGRHLVLEPYVSSAIVGAHLLMAAPSELRADLVPRLIAGRLHLAVADVEAGRSFDPVHVETSADRDGHAWRISGSKQVVLNGGLADILFVTARTSGSASDPTGISIFLVDRAAAGVTVHPYRTHDGQTAASVVLDNVRVDASAVIGEVDAGLSLLLAANDHGIAAVCAEGLGSADYLLETTCRYLHERTQFGSPLSRFQALQHRIADMYADLELARSMVCVAAVALGSRETERVRAVSAARVQVARSLRFIGQNAVQLHGAMGVSEELDVAHHFKRLTLNARQFGDERYHIQRFMRATRPDLPREQPRNDR